MGKIGNWIIPTRSSIYEPEHIPYRLTWYNKTSRIILEIKGDARYTVHTKSIYYLIKIDNKKETIIATTKTQTEAINEAKKYMKTHPYK